MYLNLSDHRPNGDFSLDGSYLRSDAAALGINDRAVLGESIFQFVPFEQWQEIVQRLQQGGSVRGFPLEFVAPIGRVQELTDWRLKIVNGQPLIYAEATKIKVLDAIDPVTQITPIADIFTEENVKIGQNRTSKQCVPEAKTMTLHQSLHYAAHSAFSRLPLLAHKEILESSTFEAADKIRICCKSREDAIALHEGRWDVVGCAVLLYPQSEFEIYHADKDQQPVLYKTFSKREAFLAGELQRREVQAMIEQVNGNGQSKGLLLPGDLAFTEIYNSVLFSPDVMTLVTEADSKPIIVSKQYAALTHKTVSYWVGAGSTNKAGWAPGELEKMQQYLERDGFLQNYEYRAYLHDYDEVTTWYTSFQRVFCDGEWMRIAKVLDIVKANLAVI